MKGFTIVELVIVIAMIAVMAAVLTPMVVETFKQQKSNIIDIYNGIDVICYCDDEIIYQGKSDNLPQELLSSYKLIDVSYKSGNVVIMMYERLIYADTIFEETN